MPVELDKPLPALVDATRRHSEARLRRDLYRNDPKALAAFLRLPASAQARIVGPFTPPF